MSSNVGSRCAQYRHIVVIWQSFAYLRSNIEPARHIPGTFQCIQAYAYVSFPVKMQYGLNEEVIPLLLPEAHAPHSQSLTVPGVAMSFNTCLRIRWASTLR